MDSKKRITLTTRKGGREVIRPDKPADRAKKHHNAEKGTNDVKDA